jgi:hypothetical protein
MDSKEKIGIFALVLFAGWLVLPAAAQIAPDATLAGPLASTSSEYRFPASIDPDILSGVTTEIWARVYRPTVLNDPPYPLILFLHGNHSTCGHGSNPRIDDSCQYTTLGTCPAGYVVTPNHNGYGYLADRLASWGYIVVSINANRGITCGGGVVGDPNLIQARGRLVLKHLQRLSEWNDTAGQTPASLGLGTSGLLGKLDLGSVGLMGHSRGGEGVRTAYNFYRQSGSPWPGRIHGIVTFQGIFEIAPVDGQNLVVQNADSVNWSVLLPMCDGDVSDLEGVRALDRTIRIFSEDYVTPKMNYTVWGANHNYYNTEWQTSDSNSCTGPGNTPMFLMPVGSPNQRQTGLASVNAFFRGTVFDTPVAAGYNTDFMQNFNPQYGLPAVVTGVTRVDRGFTESADTQITLRFEDFQGVFPNNSPYGPANTVSNIMMSYGGVPNHAPAQRAGLISWTAGAARFFQTNWANAGQSRNATGYATLDVRASRQNSGMNPAGPTNFSIRLVRDDGVLSSAVQLSSYIDLRGPVGGPGGLHPILQTARIPLTAFGAFDLARLRGVRFTFDGTATGAIYLGDIRLSLLTGSGAAAPLDSGPVYTFSDGGDDAQEPKEQKKKPINGINSITAVESSPALEGEPGVEIELYSSEEFPARNQVVVMSIGKTDFILSRYPEDGSTNTLIFTLTPDEFDSVSTGDPVAVRYGRELETSYDQREFGTLDKSIIKKK